MTERESRRMDLTAAAHARRELGPEYEAALVESFLERLDRDIDERLNTKAASPPAARRPPADTSIPIALGSLGLGVPLSAIAGGIGDLRGLLVAWTGIVAVNAAHAWGRRHGR